MPEVVAAKPESGGKAAPKASAELGPAPLWMRYADVGTLLFALPIFLIAGLPLVGWAGAAVIWLLQRLIRDFLEGRARRSDDIRTVAGLTAGSMIARGWIAALLLMGLYAISDSETALAAAVLFLLVFTFFFTMNMAMRPVDRLAKGPKP